MSARTTIDASASSSPAAVDAHGEGDESASLAPPRTDATTSYDTSCSAPNTSSAAQTDASPPSKSKQRISFKDKQRQATSANSGTGYDPSGRHSFTRCSSPSTSSASPSSWSLSPSRECHHQHSTATKTPESAASPPVRCVFTALEPSSRNGRATAPRVSNVTSGKLSSQEKRPTATAAKPDPGAPTSLLWRASPSCLSPTHQKFGSPRDHLTNLESSLLSQSPQHPPALEAARSTATAPVAPPRMRAQLSSECCASVSSTFGPAATQMSGSDTKLHVLGLRTPTNSGSVTTTPTGFSSPAALEDLPTLLSMSSASTSSPKISFKDKQRAGAASRTPFIPTGTTALAGPPASGAAKSSSFETSTRLTAHDPATVTAKAAPPNSNAPVVQKLSSPSCNLSDSASPLLPARAPSADVDNAPLAPVNKESQKNAGLARSPPAEHAVARNPKLAHPLQVTVPPSEAATKRPLFRCFPQFFRSHEEVSESQGVGKRNASAPASESQDCIGDAKTVSVNVDERNETCAYDVESLPALTQKGVYRPVDDSGMSRPTIKFATSAPSTPQTVACFRAATPDCDGFALETAAQHWDTAHRRHGSSQGMPSTITGDPGAIVGGPACSRDTTRLTMQSNTKSLEAAAPSAESQMASSTVRPTRSLHLEQRHYTGKASGTAISKSSARDQLTRTSNKIVGRWKQHQLPHPAQRGTWTPYELSSSTSTLGPTPLPGGPPSLKDPQQAHTARSHRRQRSKMLALDGTVTMTPHTAHGTGRECSPSYRTSSPTLHLRSHTVDDLALMASTSDICGGATLGCSAQPPLSPSSQSRLASQLILNHQLPPLPLQRTMSASQSSLTGSADVHSFHEGMPFSFCHVPSTAQLLRESSGVSLGLELPTARVNAGGASASPPPRLSPRPELHPTSSGCTSSFSKASLAITAGAFPHTRSTEDLSPKTPTHYTDTPIGLRSTDETNAGSTLRRCSVADTRAYRCTGGDTGAITVDTDEAEDSDGDYMLRTVNSRFGMDSLMNTTTAELRKLRRRSTYSSLHYGTMTSFHHKRSKQALYTHSESQHGRHQSKGSFCRRQKHTKAELTNAETSAKFFSEESFPIEVLPDIRVEKMYSDDDDDDETMLVQKGSDDEDASDGAEHTRDTDAKHSRGRDRAAENPDAIAVSAEEFDEREGAQRRTVGMWTSFEHVFLPRYELVPNKASTMPLTVSASPESNRNTNVSTGSSDTDTIRRHYSPLRSVSEKKEKGTPDPTPTSDPQLVHPAPTPDPNCTSQRLGSVFLGAPGSSLTMPMLLSAPGNLSMYVNGNSGGLQPSGLVVLPDANCSSDTGAAPSLSCSQIRRTPAQASNVKPLEPEEYTFGTVASVYKMDPVDEETLPDGSSDAKVAARLVFDVSNGVMLMDPEDEVSRYERQGSMWVDDQGSFTAPRNLKEELGTKNRHDAGEDEANEGACHCDASFISKDFKGPDCSRYNANDLYDHCSCCNRRPAAFLCLHCLEAVCPSHVRQHHLRSPGECTLFLNLLDIMNSFDRIFWCEKCHQFTWKHTEVYDALVDQIAYTRGTYLKQPARDIHCVGYEVRLKDATPPAAARNSVGSVIGAESLPFLQPMHMLPPATTTCKHGASASSPPTAATGASDTPTSAPRNLQLASSMSLLPNGRSESIRRSDAGYLSCAPGSPFGGAALLRAHPSTAGSPTPSQFPVQSPMQQFLSRDLLELSFGNAVTVGEPVTKLCALGARVQGWRTTQEDAEAVFLVDIPALSGEVVNRKELQAVAAAAASSPVDTLDNKNAPRRFSSAVCHNSCELNDSSAADKPLMLNATVGAGDLEADETRFTHTIDAGDSSPGPARAEEFEAAPNETIPMAVFCVFDGHGGDAVAKLAARHFEAHLRHAIRETRPDDVRARALLFFLEAETDSAAVARGTASWLPPSLASVQPDDGTRSYGALITPSLATPAYHNAPAVTAESSPSGSFEAVPGHALPSHICTSPQEPRPGEHLLVPGDGSPVHPFEPNATKISPCHDAADAAPSLATELRNATGPGSLSLVVPVTAESLRLHVASSTHGPGVAGAKDTSLVMENAGDSSGGKHMPYPSVRAEHPGNAGAPTPGNSNFLKQFRKTGATLDTWAAVDEPLQDPISASASVVSPLIGIPKPGTILAAENPRRESGSNHNTNLASASTAACLSPAAVVSIPEMEMLRQYFASIMEDALISLDDYLRSTPEGVRGDYDCVGCTACVVGITANFVLCANIGDSGAAFYTKDRIKVISVKHRVSDEQEQARIHAAGYAILNGRIEGMSAVPRALGDFDFKQCGGVGPHKQAVSAVPDVTIMPVPNDTDRWGIVLACDGVWDTATLHQVHVALTNTVNDLTVSGSAMDAVLHGADLYQRHLRGPADPEKNSSLSFSTGSPAPSGTAFHKIETPCKIPMAPSLMQRANLPSKKSLHKSITGDYYDDDDDAAQRLPQVDAVLLTAAAGVFAQCVAPEDNDEGIGLDNCSLIIVERRNIQE